MTPLQRLFSDRIAVLCMFFFAAIALLGIFSPWVAPHDPTSQNVTMKFSAMSFVHPFGTDHLGRCVFSRLIYGIRTTLGISLITMCLTLSVGTIFGTIAGFFRGRVDSILMRVCDVFMSFPSEVMLLAIVGLLGPGMDNMIIANVAAKWAWYAKMVRSSALNLADTGYVRYARVAGAGNRRIIRMHILPALSEQLAVLATLDTGWVVLSISTLSFLGLGVQPPTPEWGMMLSEAKNVMAVYPALMLPSGLAILLVVASLNYFGDSLRDAFDPRHFGNTAWKRNV